MGQNFDDKNSTAVDAFQQLEKSSGFEIEPCKENLDLTDKARFKKLELTPAQKIHVSAMMQQIPSISAAGTISQAYSVSFPQGMPHTLTALSQGGFSSSIQENGRFIATASLYPMGLQAALLTTFTAMSVVSGQYFLAEINSQLKAINQKLDDILGFLLNQVKAELLSELSFTKYAFENYRSLMEHEQQRIATIGSIQNAKKVAMKDIELCLEQLEDKEKKEKKSVTHKQMQESLDLAMQLYVMSSFLEVYYSQNCDLDYLQHLETDMTSAVDKWNKRILSFYSELKGLKSKAVPFNRDVKSQEDTRVNKMIASLQNDEGAVSKKTIHSFFQALTQKQTYFFDRSGEVYFEIQ